MQRGLFHVYNVIIMLAAADPLNETEMKARQSAYADDLVGAETVNHLKKWWDIVVTCGPFLGYYAKPEK